MPNGSCDGAQMRAILTSRLPAWMFPLPLVWPPIDEFRQPALEITMEQVSRVSGLRSLVPSLSHLSVFGWNNFTTHVTYVTTYVTRVRVMPAVSPKSLESHINIPMTDF